MTFQLFHLAVLAAVAAFAAEAQAAFAPDLAALASSPWGAWSAFAIAISLVIVLLLWYAVDDDALDTRPDVADPVARSRHERADERRAAS